MKFQVFAIQALLAFGLGAFFGYFALLVFLEYYESQRPGKRPEDRREVRKTINRCALHGAFVIGLISLAFYLNR
jgi:hypothetical protein